MGCCGCSSKSSAITAGIFGLIQAFIGLILNGFFLNIYSSYPYDLLRNGLRSVDERLFLLFATKDAFGIVKALLYVAAALNSMWIISSITLLIGNASNNACCVRQWVVVTSFVIIGDFILPTIFTISTFGAFQDSVYLAGKKVETSANQDGSAESFFEGAATDISIDIYKYYILLLLSFIKLGLITIIMNICLNVFTDRRAKELANPPGYVVMGTTVTVVQNQIPIHQPYPLNPAYPPVVGNVYPAGNIPLQPATAFSPLPPGVYNHQPVDPICNNLADPLLTLKTDERC